MPISNIGNAAFPVRNVAEIAPYGGESSFPSMYTARLNARLRNGDVIDLVTPLPANYQFQLATTFDNPFNAPLSNLASEYGGVIGQKLSAVATGTSMATGHSTINKYFTGATWTGGSLFSINIPFVVQAYEDTKKEVVDIMRDMLKLVAPSEGTTGMLTAPGPTMSQTYSKKSGDFITVEIGNFFKMSPCVIEDITCEFDSQMDVDNGCPLSAVINVTVKSYFVTTKEDLDIFFKGNGGT